jgi:ABC-2 type transport system permease protein
MLRKTFAIALLHMKLVLGNRSVFFFSLVAPIIFTALMGQANSTGFGNAGVNNRCLDVSNEDAGALGSDLVNILKSDGRWDVEVRGREGGAASQVCGGGGGGVASLRVPADFTQGFLNGAPPPLQFAAGSGSGGGAESAAASVRASAARLAEVVGAASGAARAVGRFAQAAGGTATPAPNAPPRPQVDSSLAAEREYLAAPVLLLREESAAGAGTGMRAGTEQSSPGVLVIFALLFAVSGTNILLSERQSGTLRRLLVMPMSKGGILLGKLLGIYIIGVAQMILLILAGAYIFGVQWGRSPGALSLMVLSFALVATSLGILLATLVRTIAQADALASMTVMTISALGGAWWPLDAAPSWMRVLGHAFPTAWAMDGFRNIILRGQDALAVLPQVLILLCFATLFLFLGLWRFRYE